MGDKQEAAKLLWGNVLRTALGVATQRTLRTGFKRRPTDIRPPKPSRVQVGRSGGLAIVQLTADRSRVAPSPLGKRRGSGHGGVENGA